MRLFEIFDEDKKYPPHQEALLRKAERWEKEGRWDPVNRTWIDPDDKPKSKNIIKVKAKSNITHTMTDVTPKGYGPEETNEDQADAAFDKYGKIDSRDYPSKKSMGLEGPMYHPKHGVVVYLDPKTDTYYKAADPDKIDTYESKMDDLFKMGDKVEITNGPFSGKTGKVAREGHGYNVRIDIDGQEKMGSLQFDLNDLKKIQSVHIDQLRPETTPRDKHGELTKATAWESRDLNEDFFTFRTEIENEISSSDNHSVSDAFIAMTGITRRELEQRLEKNPEERDLKRQLRAIQVAWNAWRGIR